MMLPQEFYEDLPTKSENDLFEIVAKPTGYLPEAVKLAKEELKRRNVTVPESIVQETNRTLRKRTEELSQQQRVVYEARSKEDLSWKMRLLFFLYPLPLFPVLEMAEKNNWGSWAFLTFVLYSNLAWVLYYLWRKYRSDGYSKKAKLALWFFLSSLFIGFSVALTLSPP